MTTRIFFPQAALLALAAAMVLAVAANAAIFSGISNQATLDTRSAQFTLTSLDVPKSIADSATTTSTLTTDNLSGVIADLNVSLDLTHSATGDLTVTLVSPQGTRVRLAGKVGGSGDNFTATVLDDEAGNAITFYSAPFTGTFRPTAPLTVLDGQNPNGTWTLEILDDTATNTGTLNQWALRFDMGSRPVVTTGTASGLTDTAATLGGTVKPNGYGTTARFEYGLTTDYGSTAGVTLSPDNGTAVQNVSANLAGLLAGRTYHYRLTASNANGAGAGVDGTFATPSVYQINVATALFANRATVSSSPLDIGGTAQFFDGYTSTLARSQAVNPLVVTLQFQEPVHLIRSRVWFQGGNHDWRLETADTLADLDAASGSYHVAVNWAMGNEGVWSDRTFVVSVCRVVRLSLHRLTGDNYVHLNEWQLFSGTSSPPVITSQPQSVVLFPGQTVPAGILQVGVDGSLPLTYAWQKIWSPPLPSANQPQLPLGPVGAADAGIYNVQVTSAFGWTKSQDVVVGVNGISLSWQDPAPDLSTVQISLAPPGVAGGWRFDGESRWRVSDEPEPALAAGKRKLVFKPVAGFVRPPDEELQVGSVPVVSLTRNYVVADPVSDTGGLSFAIEPAALVSPALPAAERAQWRIIGDDDTQWNDSGTTRTSLAAGDYLIECKPLAGREAPVPVRVVVEEGSSSNGKAAYPPPATATPATWNLLDFETIRLSAGSVPFGCIGQVESDQSEGSGVVLGDKVVLTAASVVFEESSLAFVTGLQWVPQQHRHYHESVAQTPGAILLMNGYAAQRSAEGSPGTQSTASQDLGIAAVQVASQGRFTGYLASYAVPHPQLTSTAAKCAVGYPSRFTDPLRAGESGTMQQSAMSSVPLARVAGGVYVAAEFEGGQGLAGAPLLVEHSDGRFYPAAIFVGGTGSATVRAIDTEVLRIAFLAADDYWAPSELEVSATTGITLSSWAMGATADPSAIQVTISGNPSGTTGHWKLGTSGSTKLSGALATGLAPGKRTIYFPPLEDRVPPGLVDPLVTGGGRLDIDVASGRKYMVTAAYGFIATSPASQTVTAFQAVELSVVAGGAYPGGIQWYRDNVWVGYGIDGVLRLPNVTAAAAGTYLAHVSWPTGSLWSQAAVLTVTPAPQTIQWAIANPLVRELAPLDLAASASSGLPVAFEWVSGPATLAGSRLDPLGIGQVSVRAVQVGNANYLAAPPVVRVIEFVPQSVQSWRQQNFGNPNNTGIAADTADPDGDGRTNLEEYAANTNPNNAADVFEILTTRKSATSYTVTAAGRASRTYVLERKATLTAGAWTTVATSGPLTAPGTVTLSDSNASAHAGFYRIRVVVP